MVVLEETAPLGRHFQGGLRTCTPRAKALGYSVRPFHGQELAAETLPAFKAAMGFAGESRGLARPLRICFSLITEWC
jgi:hypothetical protein